jgi:hypothetical protein
MLSTATVLRYQACKENCRSHRFLRELEECSLAKRRGTIRRKKEEAANKVPKWKRDDLDVMERLWLDSMEYPDYFPPCPVPSCNLLRIRWIPPLSKKQKGAE